jgi:microfibrillar-associated protein 1
MVEDEVRKSTMAERANRDEGLADMEQVNTDDENDEMEYEAWKVRELKRLKRDREEKEAFAREQAELERFRNLTEEEKRMEMRQNPKMITNKAAKGKYKFLQKYYHRGAFYLAEEENLLKRDYSGATLEDRFDKSVLPKVMQVKNFGRSGRTKYTHLVDQDTTEFDRPWVQETASNLKFQNQHAGGMKQAFEKPGRRVK